MYMRVSILICSFKDSLHLAETLQTVAATFPRNKYDMELLVDCESKRTGMANTSNRYMELFKKSTGEIIVKSDDDVHYYPGWFEMCLAVIEKDSKVGYCGAISMKRMRLMGIRRSFSDRIPVQPDGYNYEATISGMCWVFKRFLWEKYPYSHIKDWRLDGHYSNYIKQNGFKLAALDGALVKHLGQDRYKGIKTNRPGNLPTPDYAREHNIKSRLF